MKKSSARVFFLLVLVVFQHVLAIHSQIYRGRAAGKAPRRPCSTLSCWVLLEYCKRLAPWTRPVFCYELFGRRRLTPERVRNFYEQYRERVPVREQRADLFCARRSLAG